VVVVDVVEMTDEILDVVEVVEVEEEDEEEEEDVNGRTDDTLMAGLVSAGGRHSEKREERTSGCGGNRVWSWSGSGSRRSDDNRSHNGGRGLIVGIKGISSERIGSRLVTGRLGLSTVRVAVTLPRVERGMTTMFPGAAENVRHDL
jgi:hypothetical protein